MPTHPPPNLIKAIVSQKTLTGLLSLLSLPSAFLVVLPDFFRIWEQKLLNCPLLHPLPGYKVPPENPETCLHVCTRAQQNSKPFQLQASLGSLSLFFQLPRDSAKAWVGSHATSRPRMGWRKIY